MATKFEILQSYLNITVQDVPLMLLPQKAIYNAATKTLIVADLHLGKAAHFQSKGLALTATPEANDMERLQMLINSLDVQELLILGDLFHARGTHMTEALKKMLASSMLQKTTLVLGNHDKYKPETYASLGIEIIEKITTDCFLFTHEPQQKVPQGVVNICGHVHPGTVVQLGAKQSMRMPCFHITPQQIILPSFGSLTGLYILDKAKNTQQYAVTKDRVFEV